jgi:hypothetical protein
MEHLQRCLFQIAQLWVHRAFDPSAIVELGVKILGCNTIHAGQAIAFHTTSAHRMQLCHHVTFVMGERPKRWANYW